MRIIVITDHDSFAMVVLALRAGADDYLAMPINESDLAVTAVLSGNQRDFKKLQQVIEFDLYDFPAEAD